MTKGQKFAAGVTLVSTIIDHTRFYNSRETCSFKLTRGLTEEEANILNSLEVFEQNYVGDVYISAPGWSE